jgi:CheY-like chemotaxis protein
LSNPIPAGPARVLAVDDNPTIHEDFQKILVRQSSQQRVPDQLSDLETAVFDEETPSAPCAAFELDCAFQGREGLDKVQAALRQGRPYAVTFVDMRMPPGWDGVETITRLWEADPWLQVVICTAYSDYSWDQIIKQLGRHDNLVILKKPFDNIEVYQIAQALAKKWLLMRQVQQLSEAVEEQVRTRTHELTETVRQLQEELKKHAEQASRGTEEAADG